MGVNRSQALVLVFFAMVWVTLALILAVAPDVYMATLRPAGFSGLTAGVGLFAGVSVLIAMCVIGVLRRWRWVFWLLLVAFLAGLLRIPAALLELTGVLPPAGPPWYALLQAGIGAIQFAIGVLLLRGYRRAGAWGRF